MAVLSCACSSARGSGASRRQAEPQPPLPLAAPPAPLPLALALARSPPLPARAGRRRPSWLPGRRCRRASWPRPVRVFAPIFLAPLRGRPERLALLFVGHERHRAHRHDVALLHALDDLDDTSRWRRPARLRSRTNRSSTFLVTWSLPWYCEHRQHRHRQSTSGLRSTRISTCGGHARLAGPAAADRS